MSMEGTLVSPLLSLSIIEQEICNTLYGDDDKEMLLQHDIPIEQALLLPWNVQFRLVMVLPQASRRILLKHVLHGLRSIRDESEFYPLDREDGTNSTSWKSDRTFRPNHWLVARVQIEDDAKDWPVHQKQHLDKILRIIDLLVMGKDFRASEPFVDLNERTIIEKVRQSRKTKKFKWDQYRHGRRKEDRSLRRTAQKPSKRFVCWVTERIDSSEATDCVNKVCTMVGNDGREGIRRTAQKIEVLASKDRTQLSNLVDQLAAYQYREESTSRRGRAWLLYYLDRASVAVSQHLNPLPNSLMSKVFHLTTFETSVEHYVASGGIPHIRSLALSFWRQAIECTVEEKDKLLELVDTNRSWLPFEPLENPFQLLVETPPGLHNGTTHELQTTALYTAVDIALRIGTNNDSNEPSTADQCLGFLSAQFCWSSVLPRVLDCSMIMSSVGTMPEGANSTNGNVALNDTSPLLKCLGFVSIVGRIIEQTNSSCLWKNQQHRHILWLLHRLARLSDSPQIDSPAVGMVQQTSQLAARLLGSHNDDMNRTRRFNVNGDSTLHSEQTTHDGGKGSGPPLALLLQEAVKVMCRFSKTNRHLSSWCQSFVTALSADGHDPKDVFDCWQDATPMDNPSGSLSTISSGNTPCPEQALLDVRTVLNERLCTMMFMPAGLDSTSFVGNEMLNKSSTLAPPSSAKVPPSTNDNTILPNQSSSSIDGAVVGSLERGFDQRMDPKDGMTQTGTTTTPACRHELGDIRNKDDGEGDQGDFMHKNYTDDDDDDVYDEEDEEDDRILLL